MIEICSAALGEQSDPKAKITRIGNTLVVQSAVRAFQVYAAEVIRSLQGIKKPQTFYMCEGVNGGGANSGSGVNSGSGGVGVGVGGSEGGGGGGMGGGGGGMF